MDLTRATEAEAKVRQLQAEFAHAARVATLGELTGSIAHEVNQPLAAIALNSGAILNWLAGEQPNVAEARELAGQIASDAHRAADIIARIRAMASRRPPAYEPTCLNRIVEEVLSFLRHELTAHRVETEVELACNLPEVLADQTQLKQVLVNLAVNAIQAMEQGETSDRSLTLRTGKVSDGARVLVEDSGPGIAPELETRLFDSFFTTKQDGLGIGLSICRSIIEAHGGTISYVPGPGGARFAFTLPVKARVEA
jgi:C4-dicarboxylate-specific signal transduction histidine kinase